MSRTPGPINFRQRIGDGRLTRLLNQGGGAGEAVRLEVDGRIHRLEGRGPWTIGRSKSNTVVIPDPYVSRHHAWISRRDGSFYLEDLGSSNGTLLNGIHIDREPLRNGDELSFGRSRARFTTQAEAPARPRDGRPPADHPGRTSGKSGTLPYLPGLDGLRAIAVAAVLLYHANLSWIPGGFLGVTVFFVLSGYLITSLLLSEWGRQGRISLGSFWARRARRLLPALYTLLFVTLAFAAVFLPDELSRLRYDALAAFFYVTNWYFVFSHQSYFQSVGRPSLFEHLWSLAVEEQFYLVWPVLFFVGMRLAGRRGMGFLALLLAVASSVWMGLLYSPDADPSRVYYGTDTRAAELLFGAALAFVRPPGRLHEPGGFLSIPAWRRRLTLPPLALDLTGLAFLGATIVSMLLIGEFEPFLYRGGFALVSLLTLGVIAVAVEPRSRFGTRMLGWEPLRWVGLRSYSIYLWHWPVFDMTRPALDVPMGGWPLLALRLGVTVLLADLSYRFVETPIRRGALGRALARLSESGGSRRRRLATGYATACSLFLGCCLALVVAAVNAREPKAPSYLAVRSVHTGPDTPAGSERARPSGAQDGRRAVRQPAKHPGHPHRISPSQISAVGDSVMLGAASELQRQFGRGIRIDAIEGLQVQRAIAILQRERASGTLGHLVIVAIGNNGPITPEQFDQIMRIAGPSRRVVFVNDKVPRPWEEPNDQVISQGASRYGNASVVDWRSYSENRPALFWSDGIHLRPAGARAYARLIAREVYGRASLRSGSSGSARSG